MPLFSSELTRRLGGLVPPSREPLPGLAPRWVRRHPRLSLGLVAGFLCLSYLLMVNPYWHVTPDSGLG